MGVLRPEKRKMAILSNISGVIQPGRTTLLLGPPAAGKSTLLKALAGKLARERGLTVRLSTPEVPSTPSSALAFVSPAAGVIQWLRCSPPEGRQLMSHSRSLASKLHGDDNGNAGSPGQR